MGGAERALHDRPVVEAELGPVRGCARPGGQPIGRIPILPSVVQL